MLKSLRVICFSVVLAACSAGPALAVDPSLSLNSTSFLNLQIGDTFVISLVLNNPDAFEVNAFDLNAVFSASGIAELDAVSYPTIINDPSGSPSLPNLPLTSTPTANLGATPAVFSNFVSGTGVTLAVFTFQISAGASNGIYTLSFVGPGSGMVPVLADTSFSDFNNPSVLTATVSVVPEPAASFLLLGGMASLLAFSRRRHRIL